MRIKYKGEDLGEWSGMPTLQEARRIKAELDLLPHQFRTALATNDPDALCMHAVIMLARNGKDAGLDDIDGEYSDIEYILSDEEKALIAAAQDEIAGKARKRKGRS